MESREIAAFNKVRDKLRQDVRVEKIMTYFLPVVLTENDRHIIRMAESLHGQFDAFADMLHRRNSKDWWPILINALRTNKQDNLAQCLEDSIASLPAPGFPNDPVDRDTNQTHAVSQLPNLRTNAPNQSDQERPANGAVSGSQGVAGQESLVKGKPSILVEPPSDEAVVKNEAFYRGYQPEKVAEPRGILEDLRVAEFVDSAGTNINYSKTYKNFSKPKGLAVIFNNRNFAVGSGLPERLGTDVDATNISNLLTQIGYQTKLKKNLSASEMAIAMARFALKPEHKKWDSTVVVVLSHGTKGAIYGTDGTALDVDQFVGFLNSVNCKPLKEKPKLFFIQACRGERFDSGDSTDSKIVGADISNSDSQTAGDEESRAFEVVRRLAELDVTDAAALGEKIKKIPTDADIFIAYATTPGFVSWRNSLRGSWFIQTICEVFADRAKDEDLLSMMTEVNQKVANSFQSSTGHKQIPEPCFRLTKKFYFWPNFFKENV